MTANLSNDRVRALEIGYCFGVRPAPESKLCIVTFIRGDRKFEVLSLRTRIEETLDCVAKMAVDLDDIPEFET